MRDHVPFHEINQERREPGFDHVAAEHEDDRAFRAVGGDDGVDDAAEIARDEDVRE